jgi:membrane protease YdiL (CAAX protease family)
MSVEPIATPAMRPVGPPIPARPDAEDRWPLIRWTAREFVPVALMPFGLVLFAYYLVYGFLGWDSDAGGVVVTASQQLALLLPIAIYVRRTRGSLAPLGLRRGGWDAGDVVAGVGAGLGAIVAGSVVIAITIAIVRAITGNEPSATNVLNDTSGPWLVLNALMAIALAPLCEEVYFRGFLFQGLRGRFRFFPAAAISATVFAFVHVEPIRFFGLAVMGVILAGVFERRRTLVASMAAHATVNVVAVLLLFATR